MYHIDLEFASGQSKLDNIRTTPEESVTVKQSKERYIRFLTIIDVASRQLLTHLIKNKDPPTQYIEQFLERHGIQQIDPSKVTIRISIISVVTSLSIIIVAN